MYAKSKKPACLIIGFCLLAQLIIVSSVDARRWISTTQQANNAFEYAMGYVTNQVAYRLGGRLSLTEYAEALAQGKEPGTDIGVDSSAVVLNSYRHHIPNIRFWGNEAQTSTFADVSSSALYHYNSQPLAKEQLVPGDLIFFKNTADRIIGVGLFSHMQGSVIHFIVASANAGQVIITNANTNGAYWRDHFAGFGRLQYTVN